MNFVLTNPTAISALGHGRAAHGAALDSRRSGLRRNDFDPAIGGWIGRVNGLDTHIGPYDCRNNRLADLALRQDDFQETVAAAIARYGAGRIATILGTSTSGVLAAEEAFAHRDPCGALPDSFDYDRTYDLHSLAAYVRDRLGLAGPSLVISTACASSARCVMDAATLIRAGVVDAAVVGGADSLCRMTLHGFAALELISPTPCRPCGPDRTGISIGEAAGFALLERADSPAHGPRVALLGAGASSDGHHMSAPHPEGAGAIAAMRQAIGRTDPAAIDWVNLHGTGTRANDAMEDLATSHVLGTKTPVSSTKGWTGHTLGASGILEIVIAHHAMAASRIPGCLGIDRPDPAFQAHVAVTNLERPVRRVLSNAFGFGGINCSLLLGAA